MSLPFVGPTPPSTTPRGVQNRGQLEELFGSDVTREFVDGRVATLSEGKATKTYVDTQDATFAESSYYVAQDTLLIPTSSKGQPDGVATLGSDGRIPLTQIPPLGAGLLKGPYGLTSTFTGNTGPTPFKIAEIALGVTAVNFKPLVWMNVLCNVLGRGRPVVEVRIGTNTQTTYGTQTLVASGYGRAMFDDLQPVHVKPASDVVDAMQNGVQTFYGPSTNYMLTTWVYDSTGSGQITIDSGQIVTNSAWLLRVVQ